MNIIGLRSRRDECAARALSITHKLLVGAAITVATLPVFATNISIATAATNNDETERKSRLERYSAQILKGTPKFYEYLVKKSDVPALPADTPVLRVVFEERVFFDTALWDIRPEATSVLDVVAEALRKELPGTVLFVAGHADNRGSEEYNLDLSIHRANSVAEELLKRGVGNVRIWRVGFGKAVPLRPNTSATNMAINRRVEFILASHFEAATTVIGSLGNYVCTDRSGPTAEVCTNPDSFRGTIKATPLSPKPTEPSQTPTQPPAAAEDHSVTITLNPITTTVGAPRR